MAARDSAAERDPLNEVVEAFAFRHCRINNMSEFEIGQIAQQEHGTYDAPQFAKRKVQSVLAAAAVRPAESGCSFAVRYPVELRCFGPLHKETKGD